MRHNRLLTGFALVTLIGLTLAVAWLSAQPGNDIQPMKEIPVRPNVQEAVTAAIPLSFGSLKGVESVGRSTMLWFEAEDGTIRRVNVSFWENEVILDDNVVTVPRN